MGILRKSNAEIAGAQGKISGAVTGEKNVVAFLVVCSLGTQGVHMGISKPLLPLQNIVNIDISSVGLKAFGFSVCEGIAFLNDGYAAVYVIFVNRGFGGTPAEGFKERKGPSKGVIYVAIPRKIFFVSDDHIALPFLSAYCNCSIVIKQQIWLNSNSIEGYDAKNLAHHYSAVWINQERQTLGSPYCLPFLYTNRQWGRPPSGGLFLRVKLSND